MNFATTPEDEAFRSELRALLRDNPPPRLARDRLERLEQQKGWAALLADAGYAAPAWPRRWGGMELPLAQQVIYHEEMAKVAAPPHPSPRAHMIVGPTIIRHGSDAQRERFLRPMLDGSEVWCQGFSEPDAGSDLPSLATKAERDGDHYVVTGTKIWTSRADLADWIFALVRTGPPGSRERGISYLLIDLRSPDITITPIKDLAGGKHFCQVHFDGVRVPVDNRVGKENEGWPLVRTSLGHERSTAYVPGSMRYRRIVDELHTLARQTGRADEPLVRQALARMETGVRLLRLNGMRVVSSVLATGEPGPTSSIMRLSYSLFEKDLHAVALDLLGTYGLLGHTASDLERARTRWIWGYLKTRASTIGAGTAEIQRNTIAEQVLGLPR